MTTECSDTCPTAGAPENAANDSPPTTAVLGSSVSHFTVTNMDCSSEEQLIRMALDSIHPKVALKFDTPNRKLSVYHRDSAIAVEERLQTLNLGASLEYTEQITGNDVAQAKAQELAVNKKEAYILKWLLAINASMFVVEIIAGWTAQSTGLIADSLDMFADAAVYGVGLYAVGKSMKLKLRAAHISGWLQVLLAVSVLVEVLRRFAFGSEPASVLMMGFGAFALTANVVCLLLIAKNKDGGVHMKASWIFSANDVIANIGVILAGALVALTGSSYPDLIIGLIIGLIVMNGARRILQLTP